MIVPVWLHHTENPENEILVYALLDDQSDTTFISLNVMNNLDVHGHETLLSLSTMHADSKLIQSHKINGLIINDFNRSNEIQLPRTFSCASIPVKRDQIPRPEMASKWQHLAKIAPELAPYHPDSTSRLVYLLEQTALVRLHLVRLSRVVITSPMRS